MDFCKPFFLLRQFFISLPHIRIHDHLNKFIFIIWYIADNFFQVFQHNLFDYYITNIVHSTWFWIVPVIAAYKIMFLCALCHLPMKCHFASAICTVEQTREHRHIPHFGRAAFSGTDFLYNLKGFLVNDCFIGILKNPPLFRTVINFFAIFIRLNMGLKIHSMS